jgi:hydrogenase nickel incorporation protein HypA/HybF
MHEMSIAQSIVSIVDDTLASEKYDRLREVVVDVGELVAVVPESLEFCYMVITEKTKFQDSKLTINILPLVGKCRNCHSESRIDHFDFVCAECSSRDIEVIQGEELNISHLEVD